MIASTVASTGTDVSIGDGVGGAVGVRNSIGVGACVAVLIVAAASTAVGRVPRLPRNPAIALKLNPAPSDSTKNPRTTTTIRASQIASDRDILSFNRAKPSTVDLYLILAIAYH